MIADHRNLEKVRYKRNNLIEVIARIDFAQPVSEIADELPGELRSAAVCFFPIEEPKKAFSGEIQITHQVMAARKKEFHEWNFFGKKREKRLAVTPEALFVTYKQYETYETLRDEFVSFVQSFFDQFPELQAGRLGLRYVNKLTVTKGESLDWTDLVSNDLLGLFSVDLIEGEPNRIFHNYELMLEDHNLRFQFGMHNPDFPAPIRQKVFILDYDAYYSGLIENKEIPELLDKYHYSIQRLFERSITEELRRMMDE